MNAEGKKKAKGGKGGVQLFQPMTLRGVTMRNRIWLPPMDTYSAVARDGKPTPFHYQHYVSRAMGGFGMIIAEATAVTADGRISPRDVGLWNDDQVAAWHWIVDGIKQAGAVAAVQLNHAGRKGSTGCFGVGFEGKSVPEDAGGWRTVAPSPIAYRGLTDPRALSVEEIHGLVSAFRDAAQRAVRAGFEAIEIHAAHGYLISQFLDPLCNERADEYGGEVPTDIEHLTTIPGAARKTANVVLNTAFGEPTIAVDTHIFRVANRIGLAKGKTPLAVELGLLKVVPDEFKQDAHHWLILHGRYICKARKPECERCVIADLCEYPGKTCSEPAHL